MIIYLDENLPRQLAEAFDILQQGLNLSNRTRLEVKSVSGVFGRGAKDEDWIPEAGSQGACVITQDYNIKRIKHQRELCEQFDLGMIYLRSPSKSGFKYWDLVKLLTKHWEEITKAAARQPRPFAYKITSRSAKPESMD